MTPTDLKSVVMVSVLASRTIDGGFIGGVMVSVLASRTADGGFIGGVMVSVLASRTIDGGFEQRSSQTKLHKLWYLFLLR